MMWPFSKATSQSHVGIDVGTKAIKIVKIQKYKSPVLSGGAMKWGKLENYGEIVDPGLMESIPASAGSNQGVAIMESEVTKALKKLLKDLNEPTKEVAMAIPMFSVFIDAVTIPPMPEEELPQAVEFEARSHIPVSISEVKLSWEIINEEEGVEGDISQSKKRQVLLVAVPNDIIFHYQNIAQGLGLTLKALEIEIFSVMRALNLTKSQETLILLDIGAQNTNVSLVKKGFLFLSHHVKTSGDELTRTIARGLEITVARAEELKKQEGLLLAKKNPNIGNLVYPVVDKIIYEVKRVLETGKTGEEVSRIILHGGSARLKGLKEYIFEKTAIPIDIADPWATIDYPPALRDALEKKGLDFTVAIGLALYS